LNVEKLMTRDPGRCCPADSLNEPARIMWERDCGFVPVVAAQDDPRVIGVITDRDICMAAYTRGAALSALRVRDSMAPEPRTCRPGDSLARAEHLMSEAQVRRLPVVDEHNRLLGVISLADLARQALRERTRSKQELRESEVGALIAAVCHPHDFSSARV
jgi:CBS domain-containing protein